MTKSLFLICISLFMMLVWQCKTVDKGTGSSVLDNTEVEKVPYWKGAWIAVKDQKDTANVWSVFRKEFMMAHKPKNTVTAKIAVDSKYWLWVNGRQVVFEGGLKRGPTPDDTYYDTIDISRYVTKGKNVIAILAWYFGKDGFSHNDSGKAGLLFDVQSKELQLFSDNSWKSWQHPSFGHTMAPTPNYRLSESNIRFDARKGGLDFIDNGYIDAVHDDAIVIGKYGAAPFNELIERPIPQWKNFGLKTYDNDRQYPFYSKGDTIKMKLPYNAQITPYFKIEALGGDTVHIKTDNYNGGGVPNVRTEYITKKEVQSFESLGWMNGHEVQYYFPEGIKILDLKFRETGFDAEFSGSFSCDDDFYDRLWQKSLRTLYVTMRDTYMDCPDRERAQWWGDEVLESGESFYALSPSSHLLAKKGILELMNWQRPDSTLYSPVPAGNWDNELPTQMLSSVGTYGFWNYYWHTGDIKTIAAVYQNVAKYMALWKLNENGTVKIRKGGWTWGDWGENKDVPLLFDTQYYMALNSQSRMAELLGNTKTADSLSSLMLRFKKNFNEVYWNGTAYRSTEYKGNTDDRSQGLAVISGLADPDKFEAIFKVLQEEMHASPYMEKYVLEALFQMGYADYALKRMKKRFLEMVDHPTLTTLWEGWGIGKKGYGGGTINHAWSGGGLTLLSQYVAGIYPTCPAYETFQVKPQLGHLKYVRAEVPSIKGNIRVEITVGKAYVMQVDVPAGTNATVLLPSKYTNIKVDAKSANYKKVQRDHSIALSPGAHIIIAN